MKADDALLDRLLSQDQGLAATESDAILETVLARSAPAPKRRVWIFALPLMAAAAALFLFLDNGEFTARGGGTSNLRVACHVRGNEPIDAVCKPGEALRFEVEGQPYFAAFVKLPDGTVSWVLPSDDAAKSLHVGRARQWLAITAEIEAQPGRHTVYGVFSKDALTRAEIRALVEAKQGDVVERTIEVSSP